MDLALEEQVALVVGGGGSIGCAVAASFVQEGCKVAVLDISTRGTNVPDRIQKEILSIESDVTHFKAVQEGVDRCIRTFGKIDHVVYAVGAGSGKYGLPFWNLDPGDWSRVLDINLQGAVHVAHAFVPHAIARESGTMTFFTSVAGQIGSQTDPPYSAAKAALINFMQCAAKDLAPYRVRVNAISPGMVQSPLNRSVWSAGQATSEDHEKQSYLDWGNQKVSEVAPLGQWQQPAEYGAMATYLASCHARNMTGQVINIDGGQVMHS